MLADRLTSASLLYQPESHSNLFLLFVQDSFDSMPLSAFDFETEHNIFRHYNQNIAAFVTSNVFGWPKLTEHIAIMRYSMLMYAKAFISVYHTWNRSVENPAGLCMGRAI